MVLSAEASVTSSAFKLSSDRRKRVSLKKYYNIIFTHAASGENWLFAYSKTKTQ